mmetsp:Transcript_40751/g.101219  ORF Transcript_40751/g.101219 Transcript_40751/m.101219 type:complete len:235 (-) Transcript_40751:736-1440(-)
MRSKRTAQRRKLLTPARRKCSCATSSCATSAASSRLGCLHSPACCKRALPSSRSPPPPRTIRSHSSPRRSTLRSAHRSPPPPPLPPRRAPPSPRPRPRSSRARAASCPSAAATPRRRTSACGPRPSARRSLQTTPRRTSPALAPCSPAACRRSSPSSPLLSRRWARHSMGCPSRWPPTCSNASPRSRTPRCNCAASATRNAPSWRRPRRGWRRRRGRVRSCADSWRRRGSSWLH